MAADNAPNSDLLARMECRRFHGELEDFLKRFSAAHFALVASEQIAKVHNREADMRRWRPHDLMHGIEAMCACRRGHRELCPTRNDLARLMNIYNGYKDPLTHHMLTVDEDLHSAMLVLVSEQFPFQYRPHYRELSRAYSIFGRSLAVTNTQFRERFGFDILDWFRLILTCFAHICEKPVPTFMESDIRSICGSGMPPIEPRAISMFLSAVSMSIEEVGARYRDEREQLDRPYLHRLIRSAFIERPILRYSDTEYVCPIPGLLFTLAGDGLVARCRDFDPDFGRESGDSFQQYVHDVLSQLTDCAISKPDELDRDQGQRACDFAICNEDSIVLVECKAVSETSRLLLPNVLRKQNAASKIREAVGQLRHTSRLMADQNLDFAAGGRPVYAIVVVFGEIYFADSSWYWENVLGLHQEQCQDEFAAPPTVLCIKDLEKFVITANALGMSSGKLIEAKMEGGVATQGDWHTFLPQILHEQGGDSEPLAIAERHMEELYRLTLGNDGYEQMMVGIHA